MNDETDVQAYEREQAEAVGMLDPYHASLQVQYRANLQFSALYGGDLIGLDIYPIKHATTNMKDLCDIFKNLQDSFGSSHGTVVVAVPQAFSWYAYSTNNFKYRPKVQQMRASALMTAIFGARSFIFYAHNATMKMVKPFGKSFEELWKDVCAVGQTMSVMPRRPPWKSNSTRNASSSQSTDAPHRLEMANTASSANIWIVTSWKKSPETTEPQEKTA